MSARTTATKPIQSGAIAPAFCACHETFAYEQPWRGRKIAMPQVIFAIDQGTSGTTVFVVDARGLIRGRAYAEIRRSR